MQHRLLSILALAAVVISAPVLAEPTTAPGTNTPVVAQPATSAPPGTTNAPAAPVTKSLAEIGKWILSTLNSEKMWGPLFGAFFGSALTALLTFWRESRKARRDTTRAFIEEFFSTDFLQHRIAVGKILKALRDGKTTDEEVAIGFFYPGRSDAYTGSFNSASGLNEHQHLEIFLGYVRRLSHAIKQGWVDEGAVCSGIGSSFIWHRPLLKQLADTIKRLVPLTKGAVMPETVKAIDTVLRATDVPEAVSKQSDDHNLR